MVWRQGDKWRGKLCDFGSAEFMGSKMSENPGNPFYSAPEASSSRQTPKVRLYLPSTPSLSLSPPLPPVIESRVLLKKKEDRKPPADPDLSFPTLSPLPAHYHTDPSKF